MYRLGLTFVLATATVALLGTVARADPPSPGDALTPDTNKPNASISVQSRSSGVTIRIGVAESSGGTLGSPGQASAADTATGGNDGWECSANVMSIGQASLGWFDEEAPQHPGESPWFVNCTNGYTSVVWLPNETEASEVSVVVETGSPGVDPSLLAAEILDDVPVPDIVIGVNPETGVVAVPSWFWIEGYDGSPIVESASLEGVTVEVEITPTSFHWAFGDGAELNTSSLGHHYPSPSDIQHTYEQSSLQAGGAFPVSVDVTFAVRFRVVGEDWQALDPISRSFALSYPVQQIQSVLTGE